MTPAKHDDGPIEVSFKDLTQTFEERSPDGSTRSMTLTIATGMFRLGEAPVSNVYNIGAINGQQVVLGSHNVVKATIHEGLSTPDMRAVGESFALLRAEISDLRLVPEKLRNRAERAIQNAEDEAADVEPDSNVIEQGLRSARDILEAAGETYDKGRSWGLRLSELGSALAVVLPAAREWLGLFG